MLLCRCGHALGLVVSVHGHHLCWCMVHATGLGRTGMRTIPLTSNCSCFSSASSHSTAPACRCLASPSSSRPWRPSRSAPGLTPAGWWTASSPTTTTSSSLAASACTGTVPLTLKLQSVNHIECMTQRTRRQRLQTGCAITQKHYSVHADGRAGSSPVLCGAGSSNYGAATGGCAM